MFVSFRKVVLTALIMLTVLTMGAWQNNTVVSAEKQTTNQVETPLYPGLTWSSLGSSTQNIRINITGDSITISGESFEAREQFLSSFPLPQDLVNYYSNRELAKSGWVSYDAIDGSDGVHYIFYHEGGSYLSVAFLKCQNNPEKTCVAVWKSVPVNPKTTASVTTNAPENFTSAITSTFSKISPVDGATGVNASSATLKWETYASAQKYTWCVQEGSDCAVGSVDWTSTYSTTVTRTLSSNKTYHWQIRALICGSCTPKTWVYANNGDNWSFQTQTSRVVILGNAGVAGAVLSYVDGTARTVTAGNDGSYSITVPYNWSGTVTPSKAGYLFSPRSSSFTHLTVSQTIQNFTAGLARIISGNVGVANATLSYIDGTFQTTTSNSAGNYVIMVATGWTGTVTPTHSCFTFNPLSNNYSSIAADQTSQNFTPTIKSGCADVNVAINAVNQGRYGIPASSTVPDRYTNVNSGPVKVTSSLPVVTSQRAIFGNSFNELIGFPADQLTTDYWFTYYDDVNMSTWLMIGNPDPTNSAHVEVYLGNGSSPLATYDIPHGQSVLPRYGVSGGPLRVKSTNGVNIFTSQRAAYLGSFNELMGFPANQLSTDYWFTYYDDVYMSTWLMIGNPDPTDSAHVEVYLGNDSTPIYTTDLDHGQSVLPRFGVAGGPLRVTSTNGVNIFTSERSAYGNSFNELMGFPSNQLSTDYWYTYTDDVSMSTWLMIGNPDPVNSAHVEVYLGNSGTPIYTVDLAHGQSVLPRLHVVGGSLRVKSTNGVNIFTSERVAYGNSFNELMGFPANQLTTDYWFTYYDNVNMSTWLMIGAPN